MTNRHRKGWAWRRKVQTWFADELGLYLIARQLGEPGDDLTGHWLLSVECKDTVEMDLAGQVDQACSQAGPGQVALLVKHRKGRTAVDDAYVVMTGRDFKRLLRAMDR